jgi:hypothetical protein
MAEDMDPLEAAMVSAGRETSKLIEGTKGILFGDSEERNKRDDDVDEAFESLVEESPFATFAGGILPYLIPVGGAAAKGIGAVPKIKNVLSQFQKVRNLLPIMGIPFAEGIARAAAPLARGAVEGAFWGTLHADQSAQQGAAWGAGGRLVGDIVGSAATHGKSIWNKTQQGLTDWATAKGMQLPPGFKSGIPSIQQAYNRLMNRGAGADVLEQYSKANRTQANRLVTREIGKEVDEVTGDYIEETVKAIGDDIGAHYESMNPIEYGAKQIKEYLAPLKTIMEQKYSLPKSSTESGIVENTLRGIAKRFKSGKLGGRAYQSMMDEISSVANNFNTPRNAKEALKAIQVELRGLANQASEGFTDTLDDLNMRHRLIKDVQSTAERGNVVPQKMTTKFNKTVDNLRNLSKMEGDLAIAATQSPIQEAIAMLNPLRAGQVLMQGALPGPAAGFHMSIPKMGQGAARGAAQVGAATGQYAGQGQELTPWDKIIQEMGL